MYKTKMLIFVLILIINISSFSFSLATNDTSYVWESQEIVKTSSDNSLDEKKEENFLNLESESAILVEQTTGKILYAHNIHEKLHPASVTKVMSILLIMEQLENGKLKLDDQIPCSENAAKMGGSQIWLDTTETLSVDNMLKAICVRISK